MYFRDDHGFTALHWAAKEGHVGIVDLLINRGCRVNAFNLGDDTALHLASAHGHRDVVIMVCILLRFFKLNRLSLDLKNASILNFYLRRILVKA